MSRLPQRDRDGIYGWAFRRKMKSMGIKPLVSAPRLLWQNGHVERVTGTIRRECTDHIIPMSHKHLLSTLRA